MTDLKAPFRRTSGSELSLNSRAAGRAHKSPGTANYEEGRKDVVILVGGAPGGIDGE